MLGDDYIEVGCKHSARPRREGCIGTAMASHTHALAATTRSPNERKTCCTPTWYHGVAFRTDNVTRAHAHKSCFAYPARSLGRRGGAYPPRPRNTTSRPTATCRACLSSTPICTLPRSVASRASPHASAHRRCRFGSSFAARMKVSAASEVTCEHGDG